jgi:heme/copper-type cytochrome/quinol oxidase subunit 3
MTDMIKKSNGMSDTPEEREYELRAHIGAIWTGGRLFIGIYTFLIASLAFSYFYLRSSNNGLLWRPDHVTAPTAYGWSIWALTILAVVMAMFGQSRLRKGSVGDWRVAAWTGVCASVLALFLQIWEYQKLPFYPGSSGYASTFIGYSIINIITLVIVAYWLETTVARSIHMRKELHIDTPELSMNPTAQSFRANVASMTYFLGFVALACTLMFAMFYLL